MARPSKFTKEIQEQAMLLAEKGWTDVEMSKFFKITEVTWNNWKAKFPEFFKSLKEAKEVADKKVERSLYERATGYSHPEDKIFKPAGEEPTIVPTIKHYPPDTTAAIFWLKNRQPGQWREKQTVEHEGGVKIEIVDYSKAKA